MKPRARASFCHWPNETSTPPGHVGPSCVSRPAGRRATTSSAPARATALATARSSSRRGTSPRPTDVAGGKLEAEEVLEGAGQARAPLVGPHAGEGSAVDQDPAGRRLVQLAEQLDERRLAGAVLPDERHHRARRAGRGRRRRARGGRCRDRRTRRPRGGCPPAGARARAGRPRPRARPRSPRARRGAGSRRARCRAGSRSRPPSRRCRRRAARPRRGRAARPPPARGARTTRRRSRPRRRRRRPPRRARARGRSPSGRPPPGPYQRSHASRRSRTSRGPIPVTRTSLPGGAVVAVTKRCRASRLGLRAALLGAALDPRPPGRGEDRRQREDGEGQERRVDRHQERDRDPQPQEPAAGGEERHVHVVEHEHLVAQDREAVEVLGPLLVGDRRDLRLQPGHVRLERDRDPVAEASLHARAERAQEPGGRRRRAEAEGAGDQQAAVALEDALPQELQPQRQERVRQRGELRQRERGRPSAAGSWR